MKINVCAIKRERGASTGFAFELPASKIISDDISGIFVEDVVIKGEVSNVGKALLVTGTILTATKDFCARCLEKISRKIQIEFSEEFYSSDDEVADKYSYRYHMDLLDIKELIAELLLTEQPIRMLCKNDCKGLCPVCGKNSNDDSCDCVVESIDPRLIGLKNLNL